MQPLLIMPFAVAGIRAALSSFVNHKVNDAAQTASSETIQRTTGLLMRVTFEMIFNIVLFVTIIQGARQWFAYQTAVTLICAVYAGSMLHAVVKCIAHWRQLYVIFNLHHLNLKGYIHAEIYRAAYFQAQERFDAMSGVRRLIYKTCRGPDAHAIAQRIADLSARQIWHGVVVRSLIGLSIGVIYVGVFRLMVAPFLIQQTTAYTPLQAFLWPFAFACDHFVGTTFCEQVVRLGLLKG